MMRSSLISPTIRLANERKDPSWARTTMAITAVRNWCSSSTEADRWEVWNQTPSVLDAIGLAIDRMIVTQRHTAAAYRAQHVLFVIITDGYENASRRYSLHQIKQMITYERERYHWEFVFLGANIDAEQTAGDFGISPRCATDFHADGQGIKASFEAVACAATAVRGGADLDDLSAPDFLGGVRDDYRSRRRMKR